MKAKEQHNVYAQQVERLRAEKVELNKEIKATETKAYKAFCKTAKVENVNEYEELLYFNTESSE